mmetsp:Transcript_6623/g.12501  ORF Transcript_6623/g.12501 Transcript_6623/m.12501 type:complete len:207 (-) Transcript_6623:1551-2171(-)
MRFANLYYASTALGVCLTPTYAFTMLNPSSHMMLNTPMDVEPLAMIANANDEQIDGKALSTRSRYKMDINALDQLLDTQEEEKLEEIRALIKDIQETRKKNPEVAIPHKVREALAEYHRAEGKYGRDSREAEIAHEYFLDISTSENMRPEHYYEKDSQIAPILDGALIAVDLLEELKEMAHMEKSILDRFGSTDFEIGEGLLERGM